jgi:hypothetical protein
MVRDLDGSHADPTGARMHEDCLTFLHPCDSL